MNHMLFQPHDVLLMAATGERVEVRSISVDRLTWSPDEGWKHTHWTNAISDAACDAADTKLKERDDVRS